MPLTQFPIIKGDKVADNADYRDALPANLVAVQRNILGARGYLLSHPGLTQFATGQGIDRGGEFNSRQDQHYRVSGQRLISLNTDGTTTDRGEITGIDRASMSYSFNTEAIVADGKYWLYDGNNLTEVMDEDLGNPIDITWINGVYFFTDGEFIYHTDANDEFSVSANKISTSEFSADPTLAVDKTSDNQVIVFNRYTTEFFEDIASEDFRFRRISGKAQEIGIVGTHCQTKMKSVYYILGSGEEEATGVHYLTSGEYVAIATREIYKILATYREDQLKDAVLETRVDDKDHFIMVRLPNETLLYNDTIAKGMGIEFAWTIIKSQITTDGPWRGVNGVYDPRIPCWIYGDNQSDKIACLDNSVATQYGEAVEALFFTPLALMDGDSVDEIEVDTTPGHQFNSDNVTAAVSITYDGLTYSMEEWSLMSEQHNYRTRFILRQLGHVEDFIGFKVRFVTKERIALSLFKVTHDA